MNNLTFIPAPLEDVDPYEEATGHSGVEAPDLGQKWELKQLKPIHRQVASLAAQGFKNIEIAQIVNITPEYVSMLLRQPLVKEYVFQLCDVAQTQMEALYPKVVNTIGDVLTNGSEKGKLTAARLHLEATKRIGRGETAARPEGDALERLALLAERLVNLQSNIRKGRTFDENGQEVTDV
jgi:hypothetical protein